MKLTHRHHGTKHRIELETPTGVKAGPWASITQSAVLALSPAERLVMVTQYGKSSVFPLPNRAYLVSATNEQVVSTGCKNDPVERLPEVS